MSNDKSDDIQTENSANDSVLRQDESRTQMNSGRRRLIKASGPVILTLASRPVWAKQCTVSGMLSNAIPSGQTEITCGGCTPGYWKTHPQSWPSSMYVGTAQTGQIDIFTGECVASNNSNGNGTCKVYQDDGTKFDAVFGTGASESLGLPSSMTLMQALWHYPSGGYNELTAAHAVAALMNAATYPDQYGYTVYEVIEVFQDPSAYNVVDRKAFYESLNEREGLPICG